MHSIAPLLTAEDIRRFVAHMEASDLDCLLSTEPIQIECLFRGIPINFAFTEKTNSQQLEPVQRVSWTITAWRRAAFLAAAHAGRCGTYTGKIGVFPLGSLAAHAIKTEADLAVAQALLPLLETSVLR